MKERPILFSGEMVRALLDGRKRQTRRIVKPQPFEVAPADRAPGLIRLRESDPYLRTWENACPYGRPGERLWVRESFTIESFGAGVAQIRYKADGKRGNNAGVSDRKLPNRCGSVPSIHMPRHCSRLTLTLESVRVERLQEISEEDAQDEGARAIPNDDYDPGDPSDDPEYSYVQGFKSLWERINGAGSWDANPWVWVLGFRVEDKP